MQHLQRQEWAVLWIGQVTKENARVIRRDDEVRYLDKPAQDELVRIRK